MYEINTQSFDKYRKSYTPSLIVLFIFAIVIIYFIISCIKLNSFDLNSCLFIGIFVIVIALAIYGNIKELIRINKKMKDIEYLRNNGKLIKRIPYGLRRSDTKRANKRLRIIVLHYTLPNGITITLESEPRDDTLTLPKEGYADLLIDENNPDRYFIDTNINRIGGNKEEDFYKEEK